MFNYELLCCVANYGHGSKVLKIAKRHGVKGGTICMAHGTSRNRLLELLDLNDIRKELVLMIAKSAAARDAISAISTEMQLSKPNHGILFTLPLSNIFTPKHTEYDDTMTEESVAMQYDAIYTIVERGRAEDVVDAAKEAGARGGTIINARGSGVNETSLLFAMEIEPEKEIVLILAEHKLTRGIVEIIRQRLKIDEPGNGIIFVNPVGEAVGLA